MRSGGQARWEAGVRTSRGSRLGQASPPRCPLVAPDRGGIVTGLCALRASRVLWGAGAVSVEAGRIRPSDMHHGCFLVCAKSDCGLLPDRANAAGLFFFWSMYISHRHLALAQSGTDHRAYGDGSHISGKFLCDGHFCGRLSSLFWCRGTHGATGHVTYHVQPREFLFL